MTPGNWEEIANEVVPTAKSPGGLATGARRGPSLPKDAPYRVTLKGALPAPTAPWVIPVPPCAASATLDEALGGAEVAVARSGAHYRIERTASGVHARFDSLSEGLQRMLQSAQHAALGGARLADLLFVDIETTGLSSSMPLFLIGALRFDGEPRLDLFLARHYDEEKSVLAAFSTMARGKTIVTFNGKSFDWPYIAGRCSWHRVPLSQPRAHFDLLHHARRAWKHQLPDCKLQTLELYLCGRARKDDVPSSRIPDTYHDFVERHAQSGRGGHLLAPVIHHNVLDILTTAELLALPHDGRS